MAKRGTLFLTQGVRIAVLLFALTVFSPLLSTPANAFPENGGFVCTNAGPQCRICNNNCGGITARNACDALGYGASAQVVSDIDEYAECEPADSGGGGGGGGGGVGASCTTCATVTETMTESCACGETGNITKQRTANAGGVCGVYSAWAETGNTCASAAPTTQYMRAQWRRLPDSQNAQYPGPSGKMINNCAPGWTPTQIRDDNDPQHTLSEDNSQGDARHQLCLYADPAAIVTDWVTSGTACPAGSSDMGVYDSWGGANDRDDKDYIYKHDFNEESSTSTYWKWCLGVEAPATMTSRWATGSCAADEMPLFRRDGSNSNMNDEDGDTHPGNRTLCVKVTAPGATNETCPGGVVTGSNPPVCGTAPGACAPGEVGGHAFAGGVYTWTCTSASSTVNCAFDAGGYGGGY